MKINNLVLNWIIQVSPPRLVKNSETTDAYYQEHSPGGERACARILEENYNVRKNISKYGGFLLNCENS